MTKRVLIVDDEPSILVSLEFLLEQRGYAVQTASNGATAIEVAYRFIPDLVVLDLMLPIRSGYEVCEAIRTAASLRHTRILLLTARGRAVEQGLEFGADAYMTKPFSTKELIANVDQLLRQPL